MTTTQNTAAAQAQAQAEYVIIEKYDARIFNVDRRLPAEGTTDGDDDGVGCTLTSFIFFTDDNGEEHRVQLKDVFNGTELVIPDPEGDPEDDDEVEVYLIDEVGMKDYFIVIDDWNPYTDAEMDMLFGTSKGMRSFGDYDDTDGTEVVEEGKQMRRLFTNPLDDGWILISDPTSDTGWADGWEWLKDLPSKEVNALVHAINHAIAVYETGSVDDNDKEEC